MTAPNVFYVPLGVDFGPAFLNGLEERYGDLAPEDFAQIEIYVNTRRTQRRLRDLFDQGRARLLPRVRLITDLANDPVAVDLPAAAPPLRRSLEIAQLVGALLEQEKGLAPISSRFDLAESLANLMSEMNGEGVPADVLADLDVSDQSGHWQRSLRFINLVNDYFQHTKPEPDIEKRQRLIIERKTASWSVNPPMHPVIVAGSTGSRGTTALLMTAVAGLPSGAVVLPGFDDVMTEDVWDNLKEDNGGEDHPQFRFKRFCDKLDIHPRSCRSWATAPTGNRDRAALLSLALCPAPVTDRWIKHGPKLEGLAEATADMSLLEAPSPRAEANAIAVRLRQAVEAGEPAALISPDRVLTRQVTSALERWGITPDDSAGMPLQLTPPGRFLRHSANLLTNRLTAEELLVILKQPLCHTGSDRGTHNLNTTALELHLRRHGPPFPTRASLIEWAEQGESPDEDRLRWARWLGDIAEAANVTRAVALETWVEMHRNFAEALSAGAGGEGSGALWDKAAGRASKVVLSDLEQHSDIAGPLTPQDYRTLFEKVISAGELRDPEAGHPGVLIWGTLEARVQSADVVILAGLNEGTWPEAPSPDPWLNRRMRMDARLLLPERRIGLSAHDFQIAANAPTVVLSRSVRSDEAETVPSRWINRLANLLTGLKATGGTEALDRMRARGKTLLDIAQYIDAPTEVVDPAPRPSPIPPSNVRPKRLSVTQIKKLIRDPYAIYARYVLGLKRLDPLAQSPDAALRGNIIHDILEKFVSEHPDPNDPESRRRLMEIATDTIERDCPWPAMQRMWLARVDRFADDFLAGEAKRQSLASPAGFEAFGEAVLDAVDFTLTAKADRIDQSDNGEIFIYDYKTGTAPSKTQQVLFDKQLLLEAAMIERGAFKTTGAAHVVGAEFIQLSSDVKSVPAPLDDAPPDQTWKDFSDLIQKWAGDWLGYTSRRCNMTLAESGDYDHLARFGEWDETQKAKREKME